MKNKSNLAKRDFNFVGTKRNKIMFQHNTYSEVNLYRQLDTHINVCLFEHIPSLISQKWIQVLKLETYTFLEVCSF